MKKTKKLIMLLFRIVSLILTEFQSVFTFLCQRKSLTKKLLIFSEKNIFYVFTTIFLSIINIQEITLFLLAPPPSEAEKKSHFTTKNIHILPPKYTHFTTKPEKRKEGYTKYIYWVKQSPFTAKYTHFTTKNIHILPLIMYTFYH